MAIDKKLIHFTSKEKFISQGVGSEENISTPTDGSEENRNAVYGQLKGTSIAFIKDSKEIWTHGNLYKSVNWSVLEHYKAVDLGLPSGLKWADRNIGSNTPEDAGLYFAWGTTTGYTADQIGVDKSFLATNYFDGIYDGTTYTYIKYNVNNGLTTLDASDDAAVINMGFKWRMPTLSDMQELINNTTPTFIDLNNNEFTQSDVLNGSIDPYSLKGIKLTGTNNNSIFIPAAGEANETTVNLVNLSGCLWSSDLENDGDANCLDFTCGGSYNISSNPRYIGYSVRGVC